MAEESGVLCLGKDKASGRYEGDWWGVQGYGGNFRSQYTSDFSVYRPH